MPVPVLTPRLSSYWVHLVTPVPAAIARPLIQGLRNDVVVRDGLAKRLFPQISLLDYDTAVRLALTNLETGRVETAWSDALASSQGDAAPVLLATHEGIILERRQRLVQAPCPRWSMAPLPGWGRDRLALHELGMVGAWFAGPPAGRRACGADAATHRRSAWATRWTSGGSRPWNRTGCCGCGRR